MKIIFSHGKESGPLGTKIKYLMSIAEQKGLDVDSIDYTDIEDPDTRVERLCDYAEKETMPLVLVGSSMGGYVSTVASERIKPLGLFLMAPAFYMPGYKVQNPVSHAENNLVMFGWDDEVIPVTHGIIFAQNQKLDLVLINDDHRLKKELVAIGEYFGMFLDTCERCI